MSDLRKAVLREGYGHSRMAHQGVVTPTPFTDALVALYEAVQAADAPQADHLYSYSVMHARDDVFALLKQREDEDG